MFDRGHLQELIEEKYITLQKHPQADLWIYNYTQKTQYANFWNELTLTCRGLILDATYSIVARPFPKFFNVEQHQPSEIPQESFEVFEKLDGSLGILYWLHDVPYIASRGSFISDQAMKATNLLHTKYSETFSKLDKNITYLFEIVYPENRIVVDYGEREELVLLAMIDTQTGIDKPLQPIGFPLVKTYNGITDIEKLRALETDNAEGFVIKFKNGFRVKLKFAEYVRLHKIMTRVSTISIWEYLATDKPFDELLEQVPDEFFDWVKIVHQELLTQFKTIENEAKNIFATCPYNLTMKKENRKEIALYFLTQPYSAILFAMLDGKSYNPIIWKYVRPLFAKPFRATDEDE